MEGSLESIPASVISYFAENPGDVGTLDFKDYRDYLSKLWKHAKILFQKLHRVLKKYN